MPKILSWVMILKFETAMVARKLKTKKSAFKRIKLKKCKFFFMKTLAIKNNKRYSRLVPTMLLK